MGQYTSLLGGRVVPTIVVEPSCPEVKNGEWIREPSEPEPIADLSSPIEPVEPPLPFQPDTPAEPVVPPKRRKRRG